MGLINHLNLACRLKQMEYINFHVNNPTFVPKAKPKTKNRHLESGFHLVGEYNKETPLLGTNTLHVVTLACIVKYRNPIPLTIKATNRPPPHRSLFLLTFLFLFRSPRLFLPYLIGFPCSRWSEISHELLLWSSVRRCVSLSLLWVSLFCSLWRVVSRKPVQIRPPGVFWATPMSKLFGFSGKHSIISRTFFKFHVFTMNIFVGLFEISGYEVV